MKVILLKDVSKLGKRGDIVKVADGYGQNYLIKNRLAVLYTERSKELLEHENEVAIAKEQQKKIDAEALKEKMKDVVLEFQLSSGTEGRVYGAISTKQIADALSKEYGITVDKRKFVDFIPIQALGYTKVQIELYKGVIAAFNVHTVEKG